MSIFRVNKNQNYTIMSNYHFKEKNMSLKAKGLLSLMLSLPDDWDYSINGLVAICKENISSVKEGLKELKKFKYLRVDKLMPNQTKTGRIEYVYNIFEFPYEEQEKVEIQDVDEQAIENLYLECLPIENNPINKYTNNQYPNNKETKELNINYKYSSSNKENNIYIYLEKNWGRTISSFEIEKIDSWVETFNEEIVKHAIDLSCEYNAKTMAYLNGIFNNWKACGLKTLTEIEEKEEEIKNKTNKKNKVNLDEFTKEQIDECIKNGIFDKDGNLLS